MEVRERECNRELGRGVRRRDTKKVGAREI